MSGQFSKQSWKRRYKHFYREIALVISDQIATGSISDFGAGLGLYTEALGRMGASVVAYDGTKDVYLKSEGNVIEMDLSVLQELEKTDYGMSIEVLEHIPFNEMECYLVNMERVIQKKLFISVATPGQRGSGHVNCMDPEQVISVLENRGCWQYDENGTLNARKHLPRPFDKKFLVFKKV